MDKRLHQQLEQSDATEKVIRQVEKTADESILAGMVKTAVRANVGGASAIQSVDMSAVLDEISERDSAGTEAQHDGFRYDYDDNR
ncbi:hypothetical protein [Effusibacillus dendaii]|uniref:Uncharacterized protein n=1 Tax=Effusibacillus dendaii TaxID=2743772 RepID=A0A7I8D8P0_9BACL|nr:hypothetical protein [Effusibacillus dendaii]BCJ86513.1 hypothetical protein skT53_14980 [Effusibacillus dendaii]